MNFIDNIALIRTLANDYYQNQIAFEEFRNERTRLLKLIDEELNGIKILDEKKEVNETLVGKALSFLKIDNI